MEIIAIDESCQNGAEMKFCKAPFTDLVISVNKIGKDRFSPCCYNYSKYAWFKAGSIKEALSGKNMQLFRKNAFGNKLHICPDNCWHWEEIDERKQNIQPDIQWIQINISNKCNARCIFCYQTDYNASIRPAIIDEFKKYYLPKVKRVFLGGGEPLIVGRDLIEFIIKNYPHIQIGIVTNGILLNRYIGFMNRFFEVNFSLNAGTRDCYKKVMGVDCFERVVSNIKTLRKINFQGHICSSFVFCRENIHDAANYLKLCSALNIKDFAIHIDNTDPFLRMPKKMRKDLATLAHSLDLNCNLLRPELKLGLIKKIKQLIFYMVYFGPRRIKYRCIDR